MRKSMVFLILAMSATSATASAGLITSGQATISIDIDVLSAAPGFLTFNRFYGAPGDQAATLTRSQMLSPSGPPYPGSPTSMDGMEFGVNGEGVSSPTGRVRQSTDLDYDPADVLGSWSASRQYPGLGTPVRGGEQIGLDGVILLNVSSGGNLILGDFALRYAPSFANGGDPGLVVTSNFDFLDAPLFLLGDVEITATAASLTIRGDLLMTALGYTFFGVPIGTDVGDFRLVAYTNATAVPEPASLAMLGLGAAFAVALRRRRRLPDAPRRAV